MADWRQIQARIRKAKASGDPAGQLAALYEKTRDAMVAFELAKLYEKSGQNEEATRWYTAAAERFRRAEWRTKAAEALTRLGAPVPAQSSLEVGHVSTSLVAATAPAESVAESLEPPAEPAKPPEPAAAAEVESSGAQTAPEGRRRRHRGRRGGRGRRRGGAAAQGAAAGSPQAAVRVAPEAPRAEEAQPVRQAVAEEPEERQPAAAKAAEPAAWQVRGRTGEPALASRLAHLESQLRRLIASALYPLDEADQAPAGPGVFILSDSDQTTYYYVEDCQTLRIGVGNLLRAERGGGRRGGASLRARFAEYLGINESRVTKYLKDHCAVRWLQLDEGAAALAHFAIAVLRPSLND